MAQHAGRLTCPRCGANNFDTVTSCWKCSTPLTAANPVSSAAPAASYTMPDRAQSAAPAMHAALPYSTSTGDSGIARRAAIALALTFPWIGLPVGWVFMMIEDRSRQAIGRICVVWSIIALFFHLLLMYVAAQNVTTLLIKLLPTIQSMQQNQNDGGVGGAGGDYGSGMGRGPGVGFP